LLNPLHKLLQEVLRTIPSDCTFDQIGKVEERISAMALKYKGRRLRAFSFDLSSATDRIPIFLQSMLLGPLIGNSQSQAWASILVERDYEVPSSLNKILLRMGGTSIKHVRYATGQPMGALSSWVMLALTHHVLVQ
jgi:hypothetical protein